MSESIINFSLRGITTEQFALLKNDYVETADANIEVGLNFGFDVNSRMVAPFFSCSFSQNSKRFIILEVACHFEVKEEDWNTIWNEIEEKLYIPKGFATHLAILTVGTARGVLHAKTENTIFNKFFIPTVDLTAVIKEDVVLLTPDVMDH